MLDLSNYVTYYKALDDARGVCISNLAAERNSVALKAEVDKQDIDIVR